MIGVLPRVKINRASLPVLMCSVIQMIIMLQLLFLMEARRILKLKVKLHGLLLYRVLAFLGQ